MSFRIHIEQSSDEPGATLHQSIDTSENPYQFSTQAHPGKYLRRAIESIHPVVRRYAVKVGSVISANWTVDEHSYLFYFPRGEDAVEIAFVVDETSVQSDSTIAVGESIDYDELCFEYAAPFEGITIPIKVLLETLIESANDYVTLYENSHPDDIDYVRDYRTLIQQANELLTYYKTEKPAIQYVQETDVNRMEMFLSLEESTPRYFTKKYIIDNDLVSAFVTSVLDKNDSEYVNTQISRLLQEDIEIARQAVATLAETPDERAKRGLLQAVYRDDPEVTPQAMRLLAEIDGEDVQREARGFLTEETLGIMSDSTKVRRAAAEVLGKIGNTEIKQLLEEVVQNDPDKTVRDTAQDALDKIERQE